MTPAFDGFPAEGLAFLDGLTTKDKAWFDAHRTEYAAAVVEPAKSFVSDLGEALRERISPALEAIPKTNGSIAPINNDLRFSPDASPYKDHLMFRFWEGPAKKTAPTLFVRLHPSDGVGFATGVALPDLERWRTLIDSEPAGAELAHAVESLAEATSAEVVGAALKRVPKPYEPDHPRADLLRHKGLQIRWIEETPDLVSSPAFVGWCTERLTRAGGVHRLLVSHLT